VTSYIFRLRLEQGRLAELCEALAVIAATPSASVHKAHLRGPLALADAYLGRHTEARSAIERLSTDNFAFLEGDSANRPAQLAVLAEAVYVLDDPTHAVWLYEQLTPLANRCLVGCIGFLCLGSVSRYLGLLATTRGRWDDAQRHFADAVSHNERIGARPFAAHSRHAWADMLTRRDAPGDRERALELNARALSAADEMGMTWLAERALALKLRLQGGLTA
jgi:hypothetical protein